MIDDLDSVDGALRALCADVPEMGDDAFAAGRARLTAAITTPTPQRIQPAARAVRLLELAPADRRRSPPLRRIAPLLAVAASVAVVAAGAAALLPGSGEVPNPVPAASAPPSPANKTPAPVPTGPLPAMPSAPLNSVGTLAEKVRDPGLTKGEVRYWRQTRTWAASGNTQPEARPWRSGSPTTAPTHG